MRVVRLTLCTRIVIFNVLDLITRLPKYAIAKERKPGIYNIRDECQKQDSGSCSTNFEKYDTYQRAKKISNLHNVVVLTMPEITYVPKMKQPSTVTKIMSPHMSTVPTVSPSDTKLNTLYQVINSLEEKLIRFIEMASRWTNLEQRIIAIENQLFPSSNVQDTKQQGTNKRPELSGNQHVSSNKSMNTTTSENISSSTSEPRSEVITISDCNQQNSKDSFILTEDGYVVVYTDGACSNNGRCEAKAGIGVWFNTDHFLNVAEPVRGRPTNNNAEIQAATKAINQAHAAGVWKLEIHTDSQFTIKCMTLWINKWKHNNWVLSSGKPVKNKWQLIILDSAIKKMEDVRWTHVRSHIGNLGNSMADELARRGAELFRPTEE